MHDLLEAALLGVDALPPAQPRRRAGRVDHERVELLTDLKAADGYAQHIAAASRREMEGGDRVDAGTGRAAFVRGQQRVDGLASDAFDGTVRPFAVYVLIFMSLAAICTLWGTAKSKPRPSSKPE